jgi:repressor of nif and glnA expression
MATKNLILRVLDGEMESLEIMKKLEKIGYNLTYDTISRNLKQMAEEKILIRDSRGGSINQNTGRRHWTHYYKKIK